MSKKGIDISVWQKDMTDYKVLRSNSLEFAILKISEGQSKDRAFEQHYKGLREQGLPVGVYVFSHGASNNRAAAEAQFALDVLDGRELQLPIFLDMEASDINWGYNHDVTPWALAFGEVIKAAGYTWGVYANRSWWQNKLSADAIKRAGGTVWLAEYGVSQPKAPCDIWQFADNGRINGYPHNLDMNLMYKTSLLDGSGDTEPAEPTEPEPEGAIDISTLPLIRFGDRGTDVALAQQWLISLGYDLGTAGADGDFGKATKAAVRAFQQSNGLDDDGLVGKLTWAALDKAIKAADPGAPVAPAEPEKSTDPEWVTPGDRVKVELPLLRFGMAGSGVDTLQILLQAMDYYKGEPHGYFDEMTKRAVMAFKADAKLPTDDIVDAQTWAKLIGGYA